MSLTRKARSMRERCAMLLILLVVCCTVAAQPQKTKPDKAAPLGPQITEEQHREATLAAGQLLREEKPDILAATIEYPAHVFALNPHRNEYKADVLMVGVMKLVVEPGKAIRMPWAVYCRNGEAVAQKHLRDVGLSAVE